jgi:hypothetical protein
MKKIIIAIVILLLVIGGVYYFINSSKDQVVVDNSAQNVGQVATTTAPVNKDETLIANSVGGQAIKAYHFGSGADEVLFVGGIHGSYGWNTAALSYEIISYLKANPTVIPANVKVTVIPVLNPDGLSKVVSTTSAAFVQSTISTDQAKIVAGRFNGNNVDLNRNFDCDWQTNAKWQDKAVSGGTSAFSEPEALGLKNYVEGATPKAVIVFYSAAGGVFASNCHNGTLAETKTLTNVYAKASGYPAHEVFNFYETTGDLTNWLAKIGTPSISVLLTDHKSTEWSKNKLGVEAVIKSFAK